MVLQAASNMSPKIDDSDIHGDIGIHWYGLKFNLPSDALHLRK